VDSKPSVRARRCGAVTPRGLGDPSESSSARQRVSQHGSGDLKRQVGDPASRICSRSQRAENLSDAREEWREMAAILPRTEGFFSGVAMRWRRGG
jgi:hypothetical protein